MILSIIVIFAKWSSTCSLVCFDARVESLNILSNHSWCTESSIWSQFISSGPVALSCFTSLLVVQSNALSDLFVPVSSGWWMAEVGVEESTSGDEIGIGFDDLSFSPFALICASSFISFNAFLNDTNIFSSSTWSAVFIFWNQVSSVVEDAWGYTSSNCI